MFRNKQTTIRSLLYLHTFFKTFQRSYTHFKNFISFGAQLDLKRHNASILWQSQRGMMCDKLQRKVQTLLKYEDHHNFWLSIVEVTISELGQSQLC